MLKKENIDIWSEFHFLTIKNRISNLIDRNFVKIINNWRKGRKFCVTLDILSFLNTVTRGINFKGYMQKPIIFFGRTLKEYVHFRISYRLSTKNYPALYQKINDKKVEFF